MGLEPMTSAVTGRHSNQLNYRAVLSKQCRYLSDKYYYTDSIIGCQQEKTKNLYFV